MTSRLKLLLPKLLNIRLNSFSLFSRNKDIDLDFHNGVFCLAGANGLGKTTFLNIVNYGLTGTVFNPSKNFKSVNEHYRDAKSYAAYYFSGRISETDRKISSISIDFSLGDRFIRVSRNFFEPDKISFFSESEQREQLAYDKGSGAADNNLFSTYNERIPKLIGLSNFEQFVFLQHYVFTFDESRRLLFWDRRAFNQALFIGMGIDHQKAVDADDLRREMDKAGSLARNYNWKATEVKNQIKVIQDALDETNDFPTNEELINHHKSLMEEVDNLTENKQKLSANLKDFSLKWMEASSRLHSLQNEYQIEFSNRLNRIPEIANHPIIIRSISDGTCAICGNSGNDIAKYIQSNIEKRVCPLCKSHVENNSKGNEVIKRLQEIDQKIGQQKNLFNDLDLGKNRLESELDIINTHLKEASERLYNFEEKNQNYLTRAQEQNSNHNILHSIKRKRLELENYLEQKKKKYLERDSKKRELLKLQKELLKSYTNAEEVFVPLFKKLAVLFIGIDLHIRMDYSQTIDSPGLTLVLELAGSLRRENYQLSESQRFFMDIALRMALSNFMSHDQSKASLFIDTPEGSLDIAYESRAGQMIAKFVEMGHSVLMTANINTSQILQSLARECGSSHMTLHRMTSWADLSEVQIQEEKLFNNAFEQIETALNSDDQA